MTYRSPPWCDAMQSPMVGKIDYELDALERDHLVDRARIMMGGAELVHVHLYAPRGSLAVPMAVTITADAWLVDLRVHGCEQLMLMRDRVDAHGRYVTPVFPDDLVIGPAQLNPERNGRRGYPINCEMICDRTMLRGGHPLQVGVWLPPSTPATEVTISVYGFTMKSMTLRPCP